MYRPHRLTGLFDANARLPVFATCSGHATAANLRAGPLLAMKKVRARRLRVFRPLVGFGVCGTDGSLQLRLMLDRAALGAGAP